MSEADHIQQLDEHIRLAYDCSVSLVFAAHKKLKEDGIRVARLHALQRDIQTALLAHTKRSGQ